MFKKILLLVFLLISLSGFAAGRLKTSIMDPHFPYKKGPWFEGWYTRVTDSNSDKSFAVVAGVYFKGSKSYRAGDTFEGYLAVIVNDKKNSAPEIFEVFPEGITLKTHGRDLVKSLGNGKITDFELISKYGVITQNSIDINIPGKVKVSTAIGSRVSWIKDSEEGPTGLLSYLRFFPLHWYVYSTSGDAVFLVDIFANGKSFEGRGAAHQEKNWGTSFPIAWIWGHGFNKSSQYFVLSGGENRLGPLNTEFWILGYRSKKLKIDFSLKKKRNFSTTINGCSGVFTLEGKDRAYTLKVVAKSRPSTFSPVSIPSVDGFIRNGGEESFQAMFHIEIYKNKKLIERAIFYSAALEFGAGYKCDR